MRTSLANLQCQVKEAISEIDNSQSKWTKAHSTFLKLDISSNCKVVLLYLQSYVYEYPTNARPSLSFIANELNIGKTTVHRAIKKLESIGLISIIQCGIKFINGTPHKTQRYELTYNLNPKVEVPMVENNKVILLRPIATKKLEEYIASQSKREELGQEERTELSHREADPFEEGSLRIGYAL